MYQSKKTAAFLLAAVLTLSVSCGESAPDQTAAKTETETGAAQTQAPESLSPEEQLEQSLKDAIASLPEKDYDGRVFNILDRSTDYDPVWVTIDIYAEEANGDPINDAVLRRNQILEEAFNIQIKDQGDAAPASKMKTLIRAGDDTCDAVTDGMFNMSSMTTSGELWNLHDIPELHLENPWWDPMLTEELTVAGKLYLTTGDISIMDNEATWCILFNKKMVEDYDMGDPYEMVREGKWTIDKMHDMAKEVTTDLNGDGKITGEDQIGFLTERFNGYALWNGADNCISQKNADGIPEITLYNEHSSMSFDKVVALQYDNCSGTPENLFASFPEMNECFTESRGLFQYGAMGLVTDYRETEVNFGILPSPKFDEAQEAYRNTFSCFNFTAYGIPVTASDPARTGTILESMAEISSYLLTPAYFDVSLKGKFIRDEESEETMDLILNSRSFDLGPIYQWNNSFAIFTDAKENSAGTLSSQYEKIRKGLEKSVAFYLKQLEELD